MSGYDSKRKVKNSIDQSNWDLLDMYFSNHIPLWIMKSVNDDVDAWLSKTEEHVKLSKKTNPKHIALYFDDNIINWLSKLDTS